MDFQQLVAKLQEIDQSASECGDMPSQMSSPMPTQTPPVAPPSMSINVNAQGMENIADILKLIAKVNPDAQPKDTALPMMTTPPSVMSISSTSPEQKLLPDLSDEPSKEAYANEPDEWVGDVSDVVHDGNDLNKEKKTYPKVAGGDNPMQRVKEGEELRDYIRSQLLQKLQELKGAE